MNLKLKNRYSTAVLIMALGLITSACSATSTSNNPQKILDQVSKEGNVAMRDVGWARVSIFDGQPDRAMKLLEAAKKNLATVEKQAPDMVVTVQTKEQVAGKTASENKTTETSDLIPIDASLTLAEDFVATPEKKKAIAKANEHMKKGETAKALEVLRTADVGLSVSRVLMPVKASVKGVNKAIELLGSHKYYEANLALKAVQDGEIVDSVMLIEPPAPANANS